MPISFTGLFGLHLISFPEEGILRDLSSQSGTLRSYPVSGFSLKLRHWDVFCLNVDWNSNKTLNLSSFLCSEGVFHKTFQLLSNK